MLVTLFTARQLDLMALGEDVAAGLGLDTERAKSVFFLVASLMTGATVAACGLIGFVGLIVPHAARHVVGCRHRVLIPASALGGATLMVLADAVARTVLAPVEVPIGVVTAFIGGPFFLVLLRRSRGLWRA